MDFHAVHSDVCCHLIVIVDTTNKTIVVCYRSHKEIFVACGFLNFLYPLPYCVLCALHSLITHLGDNDFFVAFSLSPDFNSKKFSITFCQVNYSRFLLRDIQTQAAFQPLLCPLHDLYSIRIVRAHNPYIISVSHNMEFF